MKSFEAQLATAFFRTSKQLYYDQAHRAWLKNLEGRLRRLAPLRFINSQQEQNLLEFVANGPDPVLVTRPKDGVNPDTLKKLLFLAKNCFRSYGYVHSCKECSAERSKIDIPMTLQNVERTRIALDLARYYVTQKPEKYASLVKTAPWLPEIFHRLVK